MEPEPPTSFLPSIRDARLNYNTIMAALIRLRALYWPTLLLGTPIPSGKWHFQRRHIPDSGYASAEDDDEVEVDFEERLSVLRSDSFERAFAVSWLTKFIARSLDWTQVEDSLDDHVSTTPAWDSAVEEAAVLLALFADTRADGALTRRFSFPVLGGESVSVELRDEPYDHKSVGLQTWASASLLAERICADPAYHLRLKDSTKTVRILELGAGTGLLSIVLGKLQSFQCIRDRGVVFEIAASDYHPAVLENLQGNVTYNFPLTNGAIRVLTLDWSEPHMSQDLDKYDIILAADVVYDDHHALWIKACSERLLRHTEESVMWMIVPLRPTRTGEVKGVDDVFASLAPNSLTILKHENIPRQSGIGRADEDGYRLFEIEWV